MTTPEEIWNLYKPINRACIGWFFDYDPYDLTICFPKIQCVYFTFIDRGIKSWSKFNDALKHWFPSLKSLMFAQNYSISSNKEFLEFMKDPWLEHIWIEDRQSNYLEFENEIEKLRVFNSGFDDNTDLDNLKIDVDMYHFHENYYIESITTDDDINEKGYVVFHPETFHDTPDNTYKMLVGGIT